MPEYRPVPESRVDDFREITSYAFGPESGPFDPDDDVDERRRRMWSFGERRGLFDGDDLLVVCSHIEFTARVRGEWLPLAGLTAVASPPERRRRGLVGELIAESLAEYREREWPLSALLPFDYSFYARYGWETGCRYYTADVDVEALSVTQDSAAGTFRRVEPDDYEQLEPVYEAWLDDHQLATRRTGDWWRDRAFQSHEKELFGSVWERDGEPRGYVLYDVRDGDDGRKLMVHEFAYADHEAFVNLLRFCHDHDSQVEKVDLYGRSLDRLLDVVEDRGAFDVEVAPGQMVRIVDVPLALESVEHPSVEHAAITLAVEDDHADWNDRTFEFVVEDGVATVDETDADPDVTVGVGTLSQLFVGYLSVERAQVVGDLRVHTPEAAATLDALFPERDVFLPEQF